MANYVRYGNPWVNSVSPPAVTAAFLTGLENALTQPSGGSESGKYQLNGNANASGGIISEYMQSISRTSVPVSVTIDTTDYAPSVCNTPTTDNLSANGFHVKTTTTASTLNANVGGSFTINW